MNEGTAFFTKFSEYSSEYSYALDELPTDDQDSCFLEDPFTNLSLNDPKKESSGDSGFQLILPNNGDSNSMDAQSQGRLLLVSLLENFCDMYDQRPERNRRLYLSLCRRLSTMGILQSSDFVDESVNLRKAYRSVFKDLVLEAIESIKKIEEEPAPGTPVKLLEETANNSSTSASLKGSNSLRNSQDSLVEIFVPELSRYAEDFIEEQPLGRGGFGQVVIAKNKLDGRRYAIKKISFSSVKSPRYERIQREVKSLAQLDHPNIVRYHSAWLEEYRESQNMTDTEDEAGSLIYSRTDETGSILYDSSTKTSNASFSLELDFTPPSKRPSTPTPTRTIYIQMELCKFTLFDWIKQRNHLIFNSGSSCLSPPSSSENNSPNSFHPHSKRRTVAQLKMEQMVEVCGSSGAVSINANENRRIFKQIVKGLVHIHDHGLIHRDMKPQNIFFQGGEDYVPKIGDFGLVSEPSKDMHSFETAFLEAEEQHSKENHRGSNHRRKVSSTSSSSNMTGGLGTSTYAAPEQLKGVEYDEKSDIYSLGIILFELFYPFQTQMERAQVIRDLKEHQKFPASFVRKYPREAAFIWSCIASDPKLRPSAREIVESEFLEPEAEDMMTLLAAENDTLRTMLEWTERDVHQLHEINQMQSLEIDFLKQRIHQLELALGVTQTDMSDPESTSGDDSSGDE